MKAYSIIVMATLLIGSGLVMAQVPSQEHEAHHPDGKNTAAMEKPAMPDAAMPMHEEMQRMKSQMAEINRTTDPAQREKLLQEHMKSMGEMMKMMQEKHAENPMMGKAGMMKGHQNSEMTASEDSSMPMMKCMQTMGQRMDMMEMMMDQMMQHSAVAEETLEHGENPKN